MSKNFNYDSFKYIITKIVTGLKKLIDEKANIKHTHSATDINETTDKKFVTLKDKEKLSKIDISGDGTGFFSNDGTYKEITGGGGGDASIDDINISKTTTYSSDKVEKTFAKKDELHTHDNKKILDDINIDRFTRWEETTKAIVSTGGGNKFLADDLTYKEIAGISNPINDDDLESTTTTLSASKIKSEIDTALEDSNEDINKALNSKVDAVLGKGLSSNDYTTIEKNKLALIKTNGSPIEFLAKDGDYYKINNVGINNQMPSDTATFSGNEIDRRINDGILNLVLPTQNDAPTIWKKNYDNVVAGQVLEMQTSLNFSINNAIIQVYKFIDGAKNQTKVISDFTDKEKDLYIYNDKNVIFSNLAKIKDSYNIPISVNEDGFYETQLISKSDYKYINGFTIAVR
ncbi:hypothetical protein KQI61_07955 [Anaerocolumna aminovalerica]|uniref:hypothetical protein n=1 Tax=Anaerocolumna aminovalerica TaxID=1527 RepID=UPI001C0F02BB|nr:hypothetical protein [Anaerocolumna aminovalerica]MBU5332130.1 hypothetical protein [Anaerocolumna aminovalerica]